MTNFAMLVGDIVDHTRTDFKPGYVEVPDNVCGGWIREDEGIFSPPVPVAEPVLPDQVNTERDRRIEDTFLFQGVAYQLDQKSQQNITAKGAQAKFAVLDGAIEGDLRWANPAVDFGWIATDNTVTPMDAPTMAAFADAADLWVTSHIMAAHALKQMDPIPSGYATAAVWPQPGVAT